MLGYFYTVEVTISHRLDQAGLRGRTHAVNIGDSDCLWGTGHHPYLSTGIHRIDPLGLHVHAQRYVTTGRWEGLATGTADVPGSLLDFSNGAQIARQNLDVIFTDLERDSDGRAWITLTGPDDRQVAIWLEEDYGFVGGVHSPPPATAAAPHRTRRTTHDLPTRCLSHRSGTGQAHTRCANQHCVENQHRRVRHGHGEHPRCLCKVGTRASLSRGFPCLTSLIKSTVGVMPMMNHLAFTVEPWCLHTTELELEVPAQAESLFALSNGHICWRENLDEGEPAGLAGCYLNGVYEQQLVPCAEVGYGFPESGQSVINVTDGKIIRLLVDDEPFDVRYGTLLLPGGLTTLSFGIRLPERRSRVTVTPTRRRPAALPNTTKDTR